MPKISVILTSYNHEKYIAEAVQSVLAQTYKDFELLICDDGSTDNSVNIIKSFKDERIRLFAFKKNRGALETVSEVLPMALGEYIAIHHSDDVWLSEKIEKQIMFLDNNKEVAACFTRVEFIDEESQCYELGDGTAYKYIFNKANRKKMEWLHEFFFAGNSLCHPSVLIRKDAYFKYELLDMRGIHQLPDLLMWIRLCRHEEIYILPEKLTLFRVRRKKQSNMSGDTPAMHMRITYEKGIIVQEYKKITDKIEFLRIFPEAEKYIISDSDTDVAFSFARVCLDSQEKQYMRMGLDILYALINDKKQAVILDRNYHYTNKNFIEDTGTYDVFDVRQSLKYMNTILFFDAGSGFNNDDKVVERVYIRPTGDFSVTFKIENADKIRALVLNLNEGQPLKIKLQNVDINSNEVGYSPLNATLRKEGYDIFYNPHAQYKIYYKNETKIILTIRGRINKEPLLQETLEYYHTENVFCKRELSDALNEKKNLEHQLHALLNTRGERFLQKIRKLKSFLHIR